MEERCYHFLEIKTLLAFLVEGTASQIQKNTTNLSILLGY